MRILQITPQLPYPPDSGGRVANYHILKGLAQRHTMTLITFVTDETAPYVAALQPYCERIIPIQGRTTYSAWGMASNLFSTTPYTIVKFFSEDMWRAVREIGHSGTIDLAHIDQLHMAQYVHALPPELPVALRQQNIESVLMRRYAERAANPMVRAYATLQAGRLYRYESGMAPRFDLCTTLTAVDAGTLSRMAPGARIEAVPAGVDAGYFHPDAVAVSPDPLRLVTTGDYNWAPTADGLTHFVQNIYPLIRRAVPDVRFSVVGRCPPASIRHGAEASGIDVSGRVEDVRAEILRASVFVVPTRIGSGIRLKILEAMALHRPVVSTRIGCEGIEAEHGVHLRVADEPDEFAAHVVDLLRNPLEGRRMTEAAGRLVRERYAWPALIERLSELYESALDERGRRVGV